MKKIHKNLFKSVQIQNIPKKYGNPKKSEKSFSIQEIRKSLRKSFWDFESKESQIRCFPLDFCFGKCETFFILPVDFPFSSTLPAHFYRLPSLLSYFIPPSLSKRRYFSHVIVFFFSEATMSNSMGTVP